MTVRLFTKDATALLAEIKRQIKAGEIRTWAMDKDGDFTHITRGDQWANRAWLRPSPDKDACA